MVTRPLLVVVFVRKTHFFGDETRSRRHFQRETPFFGDDTPFRRHFEAKNSTFWRRYSFSSSFLRRKLLFLATTPFLVVVFVRKSPLFGDETLSRRLFCVGNSTFWRRDPFSSTFLRGKLHFLATTPVLVGILNRETLLFGDETRSRHHFGAGNSIFWRRSPFSSTF
ncbi:hypothetical protein NST54_18310 [Caldifermentibacillus hisashii]|uniref:hypothetical protein n=1 Tax=Caldifermentibacillus hisashii TaxID=996558 RepID=UPI0034D3F22B